MQRQERRTCATPFDATSSKMEAELPPARGVIRILLEPVAGLHESESGAATTSSPPRAFSESRGRAALPHRSSSAPVEERPLAREGSIIAVARQVNRPAPDQTVSTTRHISISCCQSRLLRAKRVDLT